MTPALILLLALPIAVACSGTATVKGPAGTGLNIDWDTTRLQELWGDLEEFIELNLEFLGTDALRMDRAAMELAMDNIDRATRLKEKIAERLGLPESSAG